MTQALTVLPWFVLQTTPQREEEAERALKLLVTTLLPRRRIEQLPEHKNRIRCPRCTRGIARRFTSQFALDQHLRDGHGVVLVRKLKNVKTSHPLFPGYVFIQFEHAPTSWADVLEANGVMRTMCDREGKPVRVHPRAMHYLLGKLDAEGYELPTTPVDWWSAKIDQRLTVTDGLFTSFEGFCKESDESGVVAVVDFLGRPVEIPLDHGSVEFHDAA